MLPGQFSLTPLAMPGLAFLFPGGARGKTKQNKKNPAFQYRSGDRLGSLGREDPLEEGMATPSSILA